MEDLLIMNNPVVAVTHDGTFHTDDVFAAAVLRIFYGDKLTLVRSRDEDVIKSADIAFDVGGIYDEGLLRFDHHQIGGAGKRENGIPYSSFGLIWKFYGEKITGSSEVTTSFDERLVQCVDGPDNGVGEISMKNGFYPYGLQDIVSAHRPSWRESQNINLEEQYSYFSKVVDIAQSIILREIENQKSFYQGQILVKEAYEKAEDKRIINLETDYPGWLTFFSQYTEVLYVLYQSENKLSWTVKATRPDPLKFELRKPFPKEWAGLREEELQSVTGVKDAIFCHNNLFIAKAKTKEGALELARLAVEY